jgi:hypothetical protein
LPGRCSVLVGLDFRFLADSLVKVNEINITKYSSVQHVTQTYYRFLQSIP